MNPTPKIALLWPEYQVHNLLFPLHIPMDKQLQSAVHPKSPQAFKLNREG